MPKPLHNTSGSGMHVHISLMKDGKNLFTGENYAGLSDTALYFIGGVIKHAHALNAFTKALAFEIGHLGIRVNAIAPGSIETAQLQHNLSVMPTEKQEAFSRMVKTIYPLGKIGTPADIGKTAAFLASDHAQWITGAIWPVDGGLTTN